MENPHEGDRVTRGEINPLNFLSLPFIKTGPIGSK